MSTLVRVVVVCIGVGWLAAVATAAPIDDAKKAFAEGKAAFERGDYETALAAYQRANMILPAPNLYYNIGTTYERLGRYQEAALAFDKYFELAGTPQNDEERGFQEKLHVRAEADRHRANLPEPRQPATSTQPQGAAPTGQPPVQAQPPPPPGRAPYYGAPYYGPVPPQLTREGRLNAARARRTRAIVLMGIGVPLCVAGIVLTGHGGGAADIDGTTRGTELFVGISAFIVGVTLWAPGAASFVRSNREVRELSAEPAFAPPARGF